MEIEFRRTGARRYAVIAHHADGQTLQMSPAPGYDPLMPHDLLHYVVERELGLETGIFGQLAKGGRAGTFHLIAAAREGSREAARERRHQAKRDARLMREGRHDTSRSEGAVYVCRQAWEARRKTAERSISNADRTVASRVISAERVDRICKQLDELSSRWARLEIGESITVRWPEKSRVRASGRSDNVRRRSVRPN